MSGERGHEDHVPRFLAEHRRRQHLGEHHSRPQVDRQRTVQLFDLKSRQPAGRGNPGVGDEHVDLSRLVSEALRLARVRQVG
jgi:hypothetical protein